MEEEKIRLQKLIADRGYCSRRFAEKLIIEGKVYVDGKIIRELGSKFNKDAKIVIEGKELKLSKRKLYFALNKPIGVVSTLKDDRGRRTIADLIPKEYGRLFPVGRLDINTSGLIFLTNDGEFANLIMHPSSKIEKTYEVIIKGTLSQDDIEKLKEGIMLDDGRAAPAKITNNQPIKHMQSIFRITIHEGKNREVRRMMESLNKEIVSLSRIAICNYPLGNIKKGEIVPLEVNDVKRIMNIAKANK